MCIRDRCMCVPKLEWVLSGYSVKCSINEIWVMRQKKWKDDVHLRKYCCIQCTCLTERLFITKLWHQVFINKKESNILFPCKQVKKNMQNYVCRKEETGDKRMISAITCQCNNW